MLTGIVVSHGNLCEAFVNSLEKIVGPVQALEAVSNEGYSLKDLTARIREVIDGHGGSEGIVFMVEFKGGSGFMAVKKAVQEFRANRPEASRVREFGIATGVSMPMLVTFVTKRDSLPMPRLLDLLRDEGTNGITVETIATGNEDI